MAAGSVTPVFIVFGQVLYWHLSRTFFNVNTQLRSDLLGVVDCEKGNDLLYGPRLSEGSKDFSENLDHVLMTDIYKVHHSLQISSCYPLIFNQITFNDLGSFLKGVFVDSVRTCACLSLSPAYIKWTSLCLVLYLNYLFCLSSFAAHFPPYYYHIYCEPKHQIKFLACGNLLGSFSVDFLDYLEACVGTFSEGFSKIIHRHQHLSDYPDLIALSSSAGSYRFTMKVLGIDREYWLIIDYIKLLFSINETWVTMIH